MPISASPSRTKGIPNKDNIIAQILLAFESISALTIVKQPTDAAHPAFIQKQRLGSQLVNHFKVLDGNGHNILTAVEIDTKRQLRNFKYILNIFTPNGNLLAAVVQRKKLPTKLQGGKAGDPSPYFRMDQLLPSKFALHFHVCSRNYRCKRLYEYNSINPTAHSHVQWGTGDLLGHIWDGHDHVVALKADLTPVCGFSSVRCDSEGDSGPNLKFIIDPCNTELVGRPVSFDVLTLQDIRCGINSYRMITRHLFPIDIQEHDGKLGILEFSDQRHPHPPPGNKLYDRDVVNVFVSPDVSASDKILILSAAFTRFFRPSAPIISNFADGRSKSPWNIVIYVMISGFLLACMIIVASITDYL